MHGELQPLKSWFSAYQEFRGSFPKNPLKLAGKRAESLEKGSIPLYTLERVSSSEYNLRLHISHDVVRYEN